MVENAKVKVKVKAKKQENTAKPLAKQLVKLLAIVNINHHRFHP